VLQERKGGQRKKVRGGSTGRGNGHVRLVLHQKACGDAALLEGRVVDAALQKLQVVGQPADLVLPQGHAHAPQRLVPARGPVWGERGAEQGRKMISLLGAERMTEVDWCLTSAHENVKAVRGSSGTVTYQVRSLAIMGS
jgi:hypothetical protein